MKQTTPRFMQYVAEYLVDDRDTIMRAAEQALLKIQKRFNIKIADPNFALCIYGVTFDTMISMLKEKRKDHDDYAADIASYFTICFENQQDETAEKIGNFMVQFIPKQPKDLIRSSDNSAIDGSGKSMELATQWNATHVINDTEFCKELQEKTRSDLAALDIALGSSELVLPLFCTIHESIVDEVIRELKENDMTSFSVTALGIATIGAQETKDGEIEIFMIPTVSPKVSLKNDELASR